MDISINSKVEVIIIRISLECDVLGLEEEDSVANEHIERVGEVRVVHE